MRSLMEFATAIALPDEAWQCTQTYHFTAAEKQHLHHLFYHHRESFFQYIEKRKDAGSVCMALYLEFFYERYCRMNTEDAEILLNGAQDLTLWVKLNYHYFQVWGIIWGMWRFLDRIIDGRIIRLGCLEFEVKGVQETIDSEEIYLLKDRSLIINVHIPEQEHLEPSKCQEALEQAVAYFHSIPPIFYCNSWLMAPVLQELLPMDSRIVQFQKLFTILETDEDDRQMEERIFDDILDDPRDYEETTSLQRRAKAHLINGGKLGTGIGMLTKYYYQQRL